MEGKVYRVTTLPDRHITIVHEVVRVVKDEYGFTLLNGVTEYFFPWVNVISISAEDNYALDA